MTLTGINGRNKIINERVSFVIKSKHNNFKTNITCLVLEKIVDDLPNITVDINKEKIPNNIKLADPNFNVSTPIDMLIGATLFYQMLYIGQIRQPQFPILQKTVWGWVVSGEVFQNKTPKFKGQVSFLSINNLHQSVERFWRTDEFHQSIREFTCEEKYCESNFRDTTTRDENGKFIVTIPFKSNVENLLGDSADVQSIGS